MDFKFGPVEKSIFEKLLEMKDGYVLNFSDATFNSFVGETVGVDITENRFCTTGHSKAKRLRAFWKIERSELVCKLLFAFLDYYKEHYLDDNSNNEEYNKCLNILNGISREEIKNIMVDSKEDDFLKMNYTRKRFVDSSMPKDLCNILNQRLDEAVKIFEAKAYLGTIFMCGSILEGIMLYEAEKNNFLFMGAKSSPKNKDGTVKEFKYWKLFEFLETARELNIIEEDTLKFSHNLRDFRNCIHPYFQMSKSIVIDEHTAKICLQVIYSVIDRIYITK